MQTINLLPDEEAKILETDKYIVNSLDDVKNKGFNYKGFILELTDSDMVELFANNKSIVYNLDGEYTAVIKYKK